jgi:hypothetical protein
VDLRCFCCTTLMDVILVRRCFIGVMSMTCILHMQWYAGSPHQIMSVVLQINLTECKVRIILSITCMCNTYVFGSIVISVESVLIRVQKQRPASIFLSSITLFHLGCYLNSSWHTSCMLLCGSCILNNHIPIFAMWLSSVISSWKTYLYSQKILRHDAGYSGSYLGGNHGSRDQRKQEHMTWLDAILMQQTHG